MNARLRAIFDATLLARPVDSHFECSCCELSFEERPAACPECRGLVVRVVVQ